MKWYIASRVRHLSKLVEVAELLESRGEAFTANWVFKNPIKPFHENLSYVWPMTTDAVESIMNSDIFVLISDAEGTDMFVELGIALAHQSMSPEMRIYIIGKYNKRSLMQLHPSIIHLDNLNEVLGREGIHSEGFPAIESE